MTRNWWKMSFISRQESFDAARRGEKPTKTALLLALAEQGRPWPGLKNALKDTWLVARALEIDIAWAAVSPDPIPELPWYNLELW